MHEGHCIVPKYLNNTVSFDGYSNKEFPYATVGFYRPIPQVIANGIVQEGQRTSMSFGDSVPGGDFDYSIFGGPKGNIDKPTEYDTFGSIGVYDGTSAGIGRVVVDSTFHHFFNININGAGTYQGLSRTSDAIKSKGFYATEAGRESLKKIKYYFCNIAYWLSRPENREQTWSRLFWTVRWDSQVRMVPPIRGLEINSEMYFQAFGQTVIDAMNKWWKKCSSYEFYFDGIELFREPLFTTPIPCPWGSFDGRNVPKPFEGIIDPIGFKRAYYSVLMSKLMEKFSSHHEIMPEDLQFSMTKLKNESFNIGNYITAQFIEKEIIKTRKFIKQFVQKGRDSNV